MLAIIKRPLFRHAAPEIGRVRRLAAISALLAGGLSTVMPLVAMHMRASGAWSPAAIGTVLLAHNAAALAGALLGGTLFDRWGARPLLGAGALGSALLMLITAASRSWLVFAVAITLFGLATSLVGIALNALAAQESPAFRDQAFRTLFVASTLSGGAAATAGGLLAGVDFRLACLGSALLFGGCASLVATVAKASGTRQGQDQQLGRARMSASAGALTVPFGRWAAWWC